MPKKTAKHKNVPRPAPHAASESQQVPAALGGGDSRPPASDGVQSRWWELDHLLVALLVLLVFLLGLVEMADADIWWHLKTGQLIWERGEIPRTDWYTYTNPEAPWIDLHWGFQLLAAGLWAIGGTAALIVAKSLLGAATFLIANFACRRHWTNWHAAACWLPAAIVFAGRYDVRPEALSLLFLASMLTILFHARRQPRLLWLLPLIQLLWVNVQGLFVLGIVVWVCFLCDAGIRRFWCWGVPESEQGELQWRRLGIISGLLLTACLMNPYGIRGALFPIVLMTRIQGGPDRQFYRQLAGEFDGLQEFLAQNGALGLFTNLSTATLLILTVAGIVSFALLLRRGRVSLFRVSLFLAFGYLAWQANRNGALFSIVGGLVLRWNIGDSSSLSPVKARPRYKLGEMFTATVIGLLLFLVPTPLFALFRPLPVRPYRPRMFGWQETASWFPHQAARFLGRKEMPQRVYGWHLGHAGVYLFHNGPERKVFADPRLEVSTRQTFERYLGIVEQLSAHSPQAETELLRGIEPAADGAREMPALLFDLLGMEPFAERMLNHPRWRPVYFDDTAIIFLHEPQAEALGRPAVDRAELAQIYQNLRLVKKYGWSQLRSVN